MLLILWRLHWNMENTKRDSFLLLQWLREDFSSFVES